MRTLYDLHPFLCGYVCGALSLIVSAAIVFAGLFLFARKERNTEL